MPTYANPTNPDVQSLSALAMRTVSDFRVRKQLEPLIAALATCETQDDAITALRDQLPELAPTSSGFNAASAVAAHVIAGFGDFHLSAVDIYDCPDEVDHIDELSEAIARGLRQGSPTPWRSHATQQNVEAADASKAEKRALQDAAKGPDQWAADVRNAIKKRQVGDVGAIFSTDVFRAAESVKRVAPDEYVRLHADIASATDKGTAKRWEEEFRRYQRRLERDLKEGEGRGLSAEKLAIDIVRAESDQFTKRDGTAYVVVGKPEATSPGNTSKMAVPRRVLSVGSDAFTNWITSRLWSSREVVLSSQARATVEATIRAIAAESGVVEDVYLRVASVNGKHYLDLCNDDWSVVEIDHTGWRVLTRSPVKFERSSNMRPLPTPVADGDVRRLWDFLNVHKADRVKVLGWLCATLRSTETYPILAIQTKANSGKSTTTKFLRRMFDPSKKEMSRLPRNADDVGVAALNNYCVCYDNIDSLSSAHQDTFCVVATGTALGGRKLYSNFDESSSEMVRRPILLNGINAFVTRTDLNSRSLIIELPQFTGSKTDSQVDQVFSGAYAEALGGLLTTFSRALKLLPAIEQQYAGTEQARAVAFAYLGEAVSRVLGHKGGEFVDSLKAEQDDTAAALAADDAVGDAVLLALSEAKVEGGKRVFSGYVGDLKDRLFPHGKHAVENWPKTGKAFSNRLRQLSHALSVHGVTVEFLPRDRAGVKVRVWQDQKARDAWLSEQRSRKSGGNLSEQVRPDPDSPEYAEYAKSRWRQRGRELGIVPNTSFYLARPH